jgi:hypothetical protein
MYRKLVSLISAGLLICLILLSGCNAIPADPPTTPEPIVTLTPAVAFLAGCTNVKSVEFNIGASLDQKVCLEGMVTKVTVSNKDTSTEIELDTSTSAHGGSLYSVSIIIRDSNAFGLDNINQVVKGTQVAVNGLFTRRTLSAFYIEISQPNQLAILD